MVIGSSRSVKTIPHSVQNWMNYWDNKEWAKTLVIAIDEYILNFLELVLADQRARTTFSKLITTKTRLLDFIMHRFKKDDPLLSQGSVTVSLWRLLRLNTTWSCCWQY